MVRGFRALSIATLLLLVVTGPVLADDEVRVTLDGKVISADEVAGLSCHDFDYPVIRCFESGKAADADVARRLESAPEALLLAGYVTAWADATYAGPHVTLSTDEPWLSDIGWNDRISSFKSFGATGQFRENSPGSGLIYSYGSTTTVYYVGALYNDKFSAFLIN